MAITTTFTKNVNPTTLPCLMQSTQTKAIYLFVRVDGGSYHGVLLEIGDMTNRSIGEYRTNLSRENMIPYTGEVIISNV